MKNFQSDKIVYAYVVGDILHMGHITHLKNAKNFGDKLVVGVLTEEAVKEKKSKPVISLEERMEIVRSLKFVDVVVPQEKYSPTENIIKIKPDIIMESDSHEKEDLRKTKKVAKKIGAKVIIMPYYPNQSSTNIKNKVKNG